MFALVKPEILKGNCSYDTTEALQLIDGIDTFESLPAIIEKNIAN